MEIECELVFEYDSPEKAERILKAVELDNEDFVEARVEDCRIISNVRAKNLSSLKHTIDDYLVCISMAEKLVSP
jgi:tRNA threonylcarbamoyladenosine modification (KEOPS) complex  Pcc1 subunit